MLLPWLDNTISLISLVMGVLVPYLIHVVNVSLRKVLRLFWSTCTATIARQISHNVCKSRNC